MYFILSLTCLIINYIAINKFIIIVYSEDLQTNPRDTQVLAEKIHDRIKDTAAFTLYKLLVILMSILFILSILNIGLLIYNKMIKENKNVIIDNTECVSVNIVQNTTENKFKQNMEIYKVSHTPS
jgi:competence protein ComGC